MKLAAKKGCIKCISYLLDKGANANFISFFKETAAMDLVSSGHFNDNSTEHMEVFKKLLSRMNGQAINCREYNHKSTLLHKAACVYGGRVKCVEYLVTLPQVDLSEKDRFGKTAREKADNPEIKNILVQAEVSRRMQREPTQEQNGSMNISL